MSRAWRARFLCPACQNSPSLARVTAATTVERTYWHVYVPLEIARGAFCIVRARGFLLARVARKVGVIVSGLIIGV